MKIALNGNVRDEAQTAAFQRRLTARLVNSIFLSASILQVSMISREGEWKRRDGGELLAQDRLIHAVGATTRPTCAVQDPENNASACVSRSMKVLLWRCFPKSPLGSYLDNSSKIRAVNKKKEYL